MRIKIWNAFASNNSGSYTIVGNFPTSELAQDVARELAAVVAAHDAWISSDDRNSKSPLKTFAKANSLNITNAANSTDEWPEFSEKPQVLAIDHQVFIHNEYTITLPAIFGQYFYARGGRVSIELNHSHYPIVAIFTFYVNYEMREKIDLREKFSQVITELTADSGPLSVGLRKGPSPAWKIMGNKFHGELVIGASFENLLDSFREIEKIATKHSLRSNVTLLEALSDDQDPLSHLR